MKGNNQNIGKSETQEAQPDLFSVAPVFPDSITGHASEMHGGVRSRCGALAD